MDSKNLRTALAAFKSSVHRTDPPYERPGPTPGGHLLLRVPLADSWARRVYGPAWVQLDAPRHLHLHTRQSIDVLARRFGLRVVHVTDDSGPFQIWGSELYRRGESFVGAGRGGLRVLGWRERFAMRKRARKLARQGLGDQACFYLQRLE